jgi:hypothetical protein
MRKMIEIFMFLVFTAGLFLMVAAFWMVGG